MNQKDLEEFIRKHQKESTILEYKVKLNCNTKKELIKFIKGTMHSNILRTIYAFANTDGGTLFIGIDEHKNSQNNSSKYEITGIDRIDEKIVNDTLKNMDSKIDTKTEYIELKEQKRKVLKVDVQPLRLGDKPQLLDGVLYFREYDQTKTVKSFGEASSIYAKTQFYFFLIKGLKENLHNSINNENTFTSIQFIDGLINHVNEFTKEHYINSEISKNAVKYLEDIKKVVQHDRGLFKTPLSPDFKLESKDKLIDNFIGIYKSIIEAGV